MTRKAPLAPETLDALRSLDSCALSNAIETFNLRLRNEGYVLGSVHCQLPELPPMVGYAVTGRIRSSAPPVTGRCYHDRMEFWKYLETMPAPRVLVMQDIDEVPGAGALVGQVHAEIGKALSCVGYVTNGSVRDLPAVAASGFHLFSGSVAVSHGYAHVVDFGEPVSVGGLKIHPGDLLHGDRHGVLQVPTTIAADLPGVSAEIAKKEGDLVRYCRSRGFSLKTLAETFGLKA